MPEVVVGKPYNLPIGEANSYTIDDKKYQSFVLLNNIYLSGCGLGVFCRFSSCYELASKDEKVRSETRDKVVKIIQFVGKTRCWGKVICTLGDTYILNFQPAILEMGFKEIDSFKNTLHGANYFQHIYSVNMKDLK